MPHIDSPVPREAYDTAAHRLDRGSGDVVTALDPIPASYGHAAAIAAMLARVEREEQRPEIGSGA